MLTSLNNMLSDLRQVKTILNSKHMLDNMLRVNDFYASF